MASGRQGSPRKKLPDCRIAELQKGSNALFPFAFFLLPSFLQSCNPAMPSMTIPPDTDHVALTVDRKEVRLTNLRKVFWSDLGLTKGDLLQYYADVADVLLPHLTSRAMVMKRYPHGASGPFFFMKRAPTPRPSWIETCSIEHGSGSIIHFP